MQNNRIYSLDYLRGLTAFSIMVFHFTSWTINAYQAEDFLGRIGLYGVSVFYVLSGLTLFLIYHHSLQPTISSLGTFALKRVFRIMPLLWLTVIGTICLNPKLFDWQQVLLSLTGLFGFIKPSSGFGTGLWSIGNELVFYTFFPALIVLLHWKRSFFLAACLLLAGISLYFGFFVLKQDQPLTVQWDLYVNPFNQIILFVSGMLLGYVALRVPKTGIHVKLQFLLLPAALILFTLYPVSGDRIGLVSGFNRVLFIAISLVICQAFYFIPFRLPEFLHRPVALTGEISYGLYLLHPLVIAVVSGLVKKMQLSVHPLVIITIAISLTFLASYLVFRYYEKPFIRLGKRLTTKLFA